MDTNQGCVFDAGTIKVLHHDTSIQCGGGTGLLVSCLLGCDVSINSCVFARMLVTGIVRRGWLVKSRLMPDYL